MEFLWVVAGIAFLILMQIFRAWSKKKIERSGIENDDQRSESTDEDVECLVRKFSEENDQIHFFDLYGTRAGIYWGEGDKEVTVVCLSAFRNGKPDSEKVDWYDFNIVEGYWSGMEPKGCKQPVRNELKKLGLIK